MVLPPAAPTEPWSTLTRQQFWPWEAPSTFAARVVSFPRRPRNPRYSCFHPPWPIHHADTAKHSTTAHLSSFSISPPESRTRSLSPGTRSSFIRGRKTHTNASPRSKPPRSHPVVVTAASRPKAGEADMLGLPNRSTNSLHQPAGKRDDTVPHIHSGPSTGCVLCNTQDEIYAINSTRGD